MADIGLMGRMRNQAAHNAVQKHAPKDLLMLHPRRSPEVLAQELFSLSQNGGTLPSLQSLLMISKWRGTQRQDRKPSILVISPRI